VPPLLYKDVPFPAGRLDLPFVLYENVNYFVDCLPIIAFEYAIALNNRHFLVPVGTGFLIWVASIATLKWKYGYLLPFSYPMFDFLKAATVSKALIPDINFHMLALCYSVVFISIGFLIY